MQNAIRLSGAIVLFVLFILQNYISNTFIKILIAAIVGTLFYFIDPLLEYYKSIKSKKAKYKIIKGFLEDFVNTSKKFFKLGEIDKKSIVKQFEASELELNKENVYKVAINNIFTKYSDTQKDIIFIIFLCHEINISQDELAINSFRTRIDTLLDKFDIITLDTKTKNLMNCFSNYKHKKALFTENERINYKKLLTEFTKKYCRTKTFAYQLFNDYKQAEEFRKTLSILISKGKLSVPLLKSKVLKNVRDKLKKVKFDLKGFIVLMNYFNRLEPVQKSLDKFPQIKIGRLYPINFPETTKFFHMRLVYPTYSVTAKEFLMKEVVNKIPKNELDKGFVAVLNLEATDVYSFPKTIDEIENENMKKSFSSIDYLRTGVSQDINEVVLEYIKSEMNIPEILSIIPFNIFVPEIKLKAKEFIIDNYDKIQKKFGIGTLFDWANVSYLELYEYIISISEEEEILSKTEWKKICKKICNEAKKHLEATK